MNDDLIFRILFLILIVVGPILLQLFLSKSADKWPGLVLPIITFVGSVLVTLSISVDMFENSGSLFFYMLCVVVLFNIPTLIFIAIYRTVRKNHDSMREIQKMNIQDLK